MFQNHCVPLTGTGLLCLVLAVTKYVPRTNGPCTLCSVQNSQLRIMLHTNKQMHTAGFLKDLAKFTLCSASLCLILTRFFYLTLALFYTRFRLGRREDHTHDIYTKQVLGLFFTWDMKTSVSPFLELNIADSTYSKSSIMRP